MENIPVLMWSALSRFIGTEEQVFIRRRHYDILDKIYVIGFNDLLTMRILHSGSRAEGLDLQGSDLDLMAVINFPMFISNQTGSIITIDTNDVKPGFVRLRCTPGFNIEDTVINTTDGAFMSSLIFRDEVVIPIPNPLLNFFAHGPCATTKLPEPINMETDMLFCFNVKSWPILANEWIERNRRHNWPPRDLIESIIHEGYLVVPIGNPNSQESFIQWRISFSLAEKKLVHSFNHTQLLCYALLKLYLKHVINENADVNNLLCSYFLKTSLFYCIEEEDINWTQYNFLDCFWVCYRRLIKWVRDEYCPNYFIKQNNMFEGKICGEKGEILLRYLTDLYHDGMQRIRMIPCLSELHIFYSHNTLSTHVLDDVMIINTEKEFLCDESIFKFPITILPFVFLHVNLISPITYLLTLAALKTTNTLDRTLIRYYSCTVVSHLIQRLYKNILSTSSNKTRYKQFKGLKTFIIQNVMDTDIYTGMLLLATLCYLNGEYEETISIVKKLLRKFKSCFIYNCYFQKTISKKDDYMRTIGGNGITVLQKITRGVWARPFDYVVDCGFYPEEIKSELVQNDPLIPTLVYSYVLLFLSSLHMNCREGMVNALAELHFTVKDRRYITELEHPLSKSLLLRCLDIWERRQ